MKILFPLLYILPSLLITGSLLAQQPGFLDESFGSNGIRTYNNEDGSNIPLSSAIQKDDKIIVLSDFSSFDSVTRSVFRYLPEGEPDNSFGQKGQSVLKGLPYVGCLALQQDNKITLAGVGRSYAGIMLIRLTDDGSADSSFGTHGQYVDTSGKNQQAIDIALQSDGKLVICGKYNYDLDIGIIYSLVARYNADGTPDLSFGEQGQAILDTSFFLPASIAIQADGKIVCVGAVQSTCALIRYNINGTLDKSFGVNGLAKTDFARYTDYYKDVVIQPDGKIIALGTAGDNSYTANQQPYIAVARYNTDGSLDESFGNGGKASIKFEDYTKGTSVALQTNGKIVAGGFTASEKTNDMCVSRLLTNGILDSSFGTHGKTVIIMENSGEESYQVGLQSNGKIILSSLSQQPSYSFSGILARYHGDPVATNPLITRINSWIQDNLLGWYSTNSSSVNYYSIQYSKNGSSFTEVKRVNAEKISAAGREPSANAYRYVLATTPTDSYYRIAAIQQDGSKAYSEVVYYPGSRSAVSLYPNPVQDVLTVTGLPQNKPTTIQLVNRNGLIISAEKIHTITFTKNIQTLQSGVYYIRILTAGNMQTLQFVKE